MKRNVLLLLALVAVFLTGCPYIYPREDVNFDTDPRILRGSWNVVLTDPASNTILSTQTAQFTPTFVSDAQYTVTASVTLEGEVHALSGTVYSGYLRLVRPQTSPGPIAVWTLIGQMTGKKYATWMNSYYEKAGRWTFGGNLTTTDDSGTKYQRIEIIRN